MKEKPTYRFELKSKRTGKKIRHHMNNPEYGFYGRADKEHDDEMRQIALGIVLAMMDYKNIYVEVYRLNEEGDYELIRTQF